MACSLCASLPYVVGAVPKMQLTVKDDASALIDPSTLVFKLMKPNGTTVTYTYGTSPQLVRKSQGIYYVNYKVDMAGAWTYRFESTGTGEGAVEDSFEVVQGVF